MNMRYIIVLIEDSSGAQRCSGSVFYAVRMFSYESFLEEHLNPTRSP